MKFLLVILLYINAIVNILGGQVENSQQIHVGEYGTYSLNLKRYNESLPLRKGSKLNKNYRGQYTITEIRHKSGNLYRCNGINYKHSNDALECLRRLQNQYPRVIFITPPHPLSPKPPAHPEPPLKPSLLPSLLPQRQNPLVINLSNAYKIKHYDIREFLSRSHYSRKIYSRVWSTCDNRCYHKANYRHFKERVLLQINLLRNDHRVGPLKENYYLDLFAQDLANKMAKKGKKFSPKSSLYGIVVGAIYYPAASTLVTHWYDEHFHYKFGSNYPIYRAQKLTQLLWKGTKYMGIGVAVNTKYLFVACYFYPKGNVNGQYRKNVLDKRFWHRFRG